MKKPLETVVTAFAIFSLFFGAGNLILPPNLGFGSGDLWWLVMTGFCISAALIPILGILAHARLQGTMFDFGSKVSPGFSLCYCYAVYAISIALPSPRTASVTHEMAVAPLWDTPALLTSLCYFMLVFIFVMYRNRILDIIGKWLTPVILLILLYIVIVAFFSFDLDPSPPVIPHAFTSGILEGYQTFDAIGAVVVGGVIIVSINLKYGEGNYAGKKQLIANAAWLSGLALFFIYAGLILTGALTRTEFEAGISRTSLLTGIGKLILGASANTFLSILIGLACFTSAVGIVTGTADFVKSRFPESSQAYRSTAFIGCAIGVVVGQLDVGYIIAVAVPALMFIYPVTISLIVLNVLPEYLVRPIVFRWVIATTLLFSIPDFLRSIGMEDPIEPFVRQIPFSKYSLGWVLPAFAAFIIVNFRVLRHR
jgi:LIVCS family branched-chain amino acid:cation transporter